MEKIFIPGIKLINRLKYPQKFGLVSLLLIFFITALLIIILLGLNRQIYFIQKERAGLNYIKPIIVLLENIEETRILQRLYLNGFKNVESELTENKLLIDEKINHIIDIDKKYKDIFDISENLEIMQNRWNNLKKNEPDLKKEEIIQEYLNLTEETRELILMIGNRANLILDPRIITYYLIDSIIDEAPILIIKTHSILCTGLEALIQKQITPQTKRKLFEEVFYLEDSLEDTNYNFKRLWRRKKDLNKSIENLLNETNNHIEKFILLTRENFIESENFNLSLNDYLTAGKNAISSIYKLQDVQINLLDNLLAKRKADLKRMRFLILFPSILVLLGIGYIFACFTLSIVGGIKYLQDKALKVAEGNLDIETKIDSQDELKSLSASINTMIHGLKIYINREKLIKESLITSIEAQNMKEALNKIITAIAKTFNAERCFFVGYDADNDIFLPVEKNLCYTISPEVEDVTGKVFTAKEVQPYTDFVFKEKKVLAVSNVTELSLPPETQALMEKFRVKSFMMAPLFFANKPIGVLIMDNVFKQRDYSEEERILFESIAYNSSIVLNQANLMNELEKALSTEKILRKLTQDIGKFTTHDEIDDYIITQLLNILKVDKSIHFHLEDNILKWHGKKQTGEEIEHIEGKFIEKNVALEILPNPDEIICSIDLDKDIKNEELKNTLKQEGIRSFMVYPTSSKIPRLIRKDVIEMTMVADSKPNEWTIEDKNLFKLIMDTISIVSLETLQRQELEETRKTFISTLTHDLKSPIIAEQKILEVLLSPKIIDKPEKHIEYLKDMYQTNEEVLKLINNLLSVYHYESGKYSLQKKPENIKTAIEDVVNTLKYLAEDRDAEIFCNIKEGLPPVNIDVNEIKRVFLNLIGNALKHNPKGIQIYIDVEKQDNSLLCKVKDNGSGIPEEIAAGLFQKYMTKKGAIGSGLGLYISKQIVEAHDGQIWFDTAPGQGTIFYFTLPL